MSNEENFSAVYRQPNNDSNLVRLRLDSSEIINNIEVFLRGEEAYQNVKEDGTVETVVRTVGIPKMNNRGITEILSWLRGVVNPQVVQGNFPCDKFQHSEKYEQYIYEFQVSLTKHIIVNAPDWQILDEEITGLIDFIMLIIQPFMSRLIGDKERESYSKTMESSQKQVYEKSGSNVGRLFQR